ncbi:succinate dehydrogenase, hydrophobic membrane anchor protein [Kaarinaea lacus]
MSMRATSGLGAWTLQRLSAVYMIIFSVYALAQYLTNESISYASWVAWVAHPFNNIAVGLLILSLLAHAWVGARDIILDYVKPFYFRMIKLGATAFLLVAMGLWALNVLMNVVAM